MNSFTFGCLLRWLFVDNIHHLPLDRLFLKNKSILVPNKVRGLGVEAILFHAAFEQANDVAVVRVLGER